MCPLKSWLFYILVNIFSLLVAHTEYMYYNYKQRELKQTKNVRNKLQWCMSNEDRQ